MHYSAAYFTAFTSIDFTTASTAVNAKATFLLMLLLLLLLLLLLFCCAVFNAATVTATALTSIDATTAFISIDVTTAATTATALTST